jgi:ubiquinone/menaquinone biosynthesis C-methylase UbiE
MTVNLSFSDAQRPTRGIEHFYTDLHDVMNDRSEDGGPFPSAREFKRFLSRDYPGKMAGLRCLDAGCGGTAINSRTLVAAGAGTVIGVDLNRDSLRLVRASLSDRSQGFSIACGSVLNLPFPTASFDFVVCSGVVHHTPNPEQALRELRRIVRADGRLYVSVYCFEDSLMLPVVKLWRQMARLIPFSLMHRLFRWSTVVNDYVLDHMYVPILWIYRPSDFSELLERCGFAVEETFVSGFDRFHGRRLGRWSMTGGGLLRIFLCRPAPAAE